MRTALRDDFPAQGETATLRRVSTRTGVPIKQLSWACRMSADMMHLDHTDLYDGVEAIVSAGDFIEKTDGAQLLFI